MASTVNDIDISALHPDIREEMNEEAELLCRSFYGKKFTKLQRMQMLCAIIKGYIIGKTM